MRGLISHDSIRPRNCWLSGGVSSGHLTLLETWAARVSRGSISLLFLDEREASDDVFVEHAHLTSSFFIASPDLDPQVFVESTNLCPQAFLNSPNLGPQALVDSLDFCRQALIASTNLVSHRRKLTANLVAELQELRLEASHLFGQRFEALQATLQPIYTTGKSLPRHRR